MELAFRRGQMVLDERTAVLVRRLSHYLRDNPLASDTAEGIARWWLHVEWVPNEPNLNEALARMVSSGVMERLTGPDGRVRYRRSQAEGVEAKLAALAAPRPQQ